MSYRVFISYSHQDQDAHDVVFDLLKGAGLSPVSDTQLSLGSGFTDQIKRLITHAHVFVPILTELSHKRGWVHQEIGFAEAKRVPVIPVCVGGLPEGMIQMQHAVVADTVNDKALRRLGEENFDALIESSAKASRDVGELAEGPAERGRVIARFADEAYTTLRKPQVVRQGGGLGSFTLPDEGPRHEIWAKRYGNQPRGEDHYRDYHKELTSLLRHARGAGCKLMIQADLDLDKDYGEGVTAVRLGILREFLESMTDEQVEIALVTGEKMISSLMVGDWFHAGSALLKPVHGIGHTLIQSHAPTITHRIADFDKKLEKRMQRQGSPAGQSRSWAIEELGRLIAARPTSTS